MKILLIDFYDSFTFNLKHYLECENRVVDVIRHDMIGEIEFLDSYSHIILSPGPGLPMEKTNMLEIISFCENRSKSSNFLRMRRLKEIETPQVSLTPQQGWGSAPKLDYSRERFINFSDLLFYLKIIPC